MIYVDAAAVVKLLRREPHSSDLVAWLNARMRVPLVSSALVEIEVPRALRRTAPDALSAVDSVMARIHRLDIDDGVRKAAASLPDPTLRTLDAVHLATASLLRDRHAGDLRFFVTYDRRLLTAAAAAGLPVSSPGTG